MSHVSVWDMEMNTSATVSVRYSLYICSYSNILVARSTNDDKPRCSFQNVFPSGTCLSSNLLYRIGDSRHMCSRQTEVPVETATSLRRLPRY